MFIGHFAVAFAAKRAAPRTSFTTLAAASQFLDILWPLFLWMGLERVRIVPDAARFLKLDFESYPISHSLVTSLGWGMLFALVYRLRTGYSRGALVAGLVVFSHWMLDYFTHRPDLPIAPGLVTTLGLGLWNHPAATMTIEIAMYVAGFAIYLATTRARGLWGHVSAWSLALVLLLLYFASSFGPPPPNVGVLESMGILYLIFLLWFWWLDRTRELRPGIA